MSLLGLFGTNKTSASPFTTGVSGTTPISGLFTTGTGGNVQTGSTFNIFGGPLSSNTTPAIFNASSAIGTGSAGNAGVNIFANTISHGMPIGSNNNQLNPGTQKDPFVIKRNKDDFEVHAYNYNEKYSCYPLKMLRLQDYINFKNGYILDEHKNSVARYFQGVKNPRFVPNAGMTQGLASNIFSTGSAIPMGPASGTGIFGTQSAQNNTGMSPGIFGAGPGTSSVGNIFSKPNTGVFGGASSSSLTGLFGQAGTSQSATTNIFGGGSNNSGGNTSGVTFGGTNIFGQGGSGVNAFGQSTSNNIFGAKPDNQQVINAFGQPINQNQNIFGGNAQQSGAAANIFGQPNQSPGFNNIFGNPQQQGQQGYGFNTNVFGNNQGANTGIFGQQQQQAVDIF